MSRATRYVIVLLLALTGIRLILIGLIDLAPDEAYYTLWSQRPDLCYYSKGPGVAMAIWIGTHVAGLNEYGVRLLSPLLGLGSGLLLYGLTRKLYSDAAAFWVVVAAACIPILHVGGVLMTIDPLSIFFWLAALYTFRLALDRAPAFSAWWPATGALIGAGFLCKYTNAFQLLGIALALALYPGWRREWLRPGLYSMLAVFSLASLPPIFWNARYDWVTVSHMEGHLSHGDSAGPWLQPSELLQFVGGQLGVYSPLIAIGLAWALIATFPKWRRDERAGFLLPFIVPIMALYLTLSLSESGEANWTAPGMVTLLVIAVPWWLERCRSAAWCRAFCGTALVLGIVMSILTLDTDVARMAGVPWPYRRDPAGRLQAWRTSGEAVGRIRKDIEKTEGKQVFVIAGYYDTAAALSFYMPEADPVGPGHPPVYAPETQDIENQFAFWPRYDGYVLPSEAPELYRDYLERIGEDPPVTSGDPQGFNPFIGRDALFITDDVAEDLTRPRSPYQVREGFESWERIGDLTIRRRGQKVRVLRLFLCRNYQTKDL